MSSLGATGHQSRQELLTWINSLELDYPVSKHENTPFAKHFDITRRFKIRCRGRK